MTSSNRTSATQSSSIHLLRLAWCCALTLCGVYEFDRIGYAAQSAGGILSALFDWNADTTLPFIVLLALPILIILRRISGAAIQQSTARSGLGRTPDRSPRRLDTLVLAALSLAGSTAIGLRMIDVPRPDGRVSQLRFCDLPPAYHDEFSYLLQARTFLAGRVTWPAAEVHPDLFHQIHVLNEPTTASRYFPWTGLWMAPFVAMNRPYLGHWIAGAFACALFHRSLLRLLEPRWALIGGLLIATSPGLSIFSNLLLAHHPTLLALSVFLWAFLKMMESRSVGDSMLAGTGLALAMLGRPMTAAGFALPFGCWLLWNVIRPGFATDSQPVTRQTMIRICVAMGLPLIAGFLVLAFMNDRITGSWTKSAYQLYTDTWTPRHRFGFNNAAIGDRLAGPKVLESYDRWATNLTPQVAAVNLRNRVVAESQWTLGIVSLLFLMIIAVPTALQFSRTRPPCPETSESPAPRGDCRLVLIVLSIVSLYLVHIPYWYDGILHWHYVFESAPLILMVATCGLRLAFDTLRTQLPTRWASLWLAMLILAGWLPDWLTAEALWGTSRIAAAVSEQSFSRIRFEQFRMLTSMPRIRKPCLIMVDERSADPQLSFIVNPPDLASDVLICRRPKDSTMISELRLAFPDRALYEFQPQTFELTSLP
ncbi:MAG: ArnT family glycosyltransferase [Planctomycetota bacterium]